MICIFENIFKNRKQWQRASGDFGPLRFFFVFAALILLALPASTRDAQEANSTVSNYYYYDLPYVPQKKDYGFEIGSMAMKTGLYWLGINFGLNGGSCFKIENPNCQQYWDLGFGAGGKEAETQYIGEISARFQFVHFPSSWSPFARGFIGIQNTIMPDNTGHTFTYGLGGGITRNVHEKLDLRFEVRAGYSYQAYFQGIIGLQFKIDKNIEHFGNKLKELGLDTVRQTGRVLKGTVEGTVEGTGKLLQGIGTTIKGGKKTEPPSQEN